MHNISLILCKSPLQTPPEIWPLWAITSCQSQNTEPRCWEAGAFSTHSRQGGHGQKINPHTGQVWRRNHVYLSMNSPHGRPPLLGDSSTGVSCTARGRKCQNTPTTFSSTKPPSRETPWQSERSYAAFVDASENPSSLFACVMSGI